MSRYPIISQGGPVTSEPIPFSCPEIDAIISRLEELRKINFALRSDNTALATEVWRLGQALARYEESDRIQSGL
jgi:hypothetical protein